MSEQLLALLLLTVVFLPCHSCLFSWWCFFYQTRPGTGSDSTTVHQHSIMTYPGVGNVRLTDRILSLIFICAPRHAFTKNNTFTYSLSLNVGVFSPCKATIHETSTMPSLMECPMHPLFLDRKLA